jgi:hypothetical protein
MGTLPSSYQALDVNHIRAGLTDSSWGSMAVLYDPDDITPDYIGLNVSSTETHSASTWKIIRFVRNAAGNVIRNYAEYGAWSNRSSLFLE